MRFILLPVSNRPSYINAFWARSSFARMSRFCTWTPFGHLTELSVTLAQWGVSKGLLMKRRVFIAISGKQRYLRSVQIRGKTQNSSIWCELKRILGFGRSITPRKDRFAVLGYANRLLINNGMSTDICFEQGIQEYEADILLLNSDFSTGIFERTFMDSGAALPVSGYLFWPYSEAR